MNIITKRIAYFGFTCLWAGEVWWLSEHWPVLSAAPLLFWLFAAVGLVSATHTVNFYGVGEWFRWPFTVVVPDSAGGLSSVEPKPGRFEVVGELMCCYACAGTHLATLLLVVYVLRPALGMALAAALFLATANVILHHITEWMQWSARLAIERQGTEWLAKHQPDSALFIETENVRALIEQGR